ncbi:hypothetical protein ACWOMK_02215 [Bacillus thuringiensis]
MANAPKLDGQETIAESYYKINMSIDNANDALQKSSQAKSEVVEARGDEPSLNARIETVTNELNRVKQGVALTEVQDLYTVQKGYIKAPGYTVVTGDPNYVYTDFIDIEPGTIIDYKLRGQSVVYNVSFYDDAKNPIYGFISDKPDYNTPSKGTVIAPKNVKFVRYCWAERYNGTGTFGDAYIALGTNLIEQMTDLEIILTTDFCKSATHTGYIGTNGQVANTNDTNWVYTDFHEIDPAYNLKYRVYGHTSIGSINFYDANKNFISTTSAPDTSTPITKAIPIPLNAKYIRLSFASPVVYPTKISSAIYSKTLKEDVEELKQAVMDLQSESGSGEKPALNYIYPRKIYTVCNDIINNKKGHNRNYSAAIYLDHFFKGFTSEKHIRFVNNLDRMVFNAPIEVIDANEITPAVTYNGGVNVLEATKTVGITGNDIVDSSFNVIHVSTLNSATAKGKPRVLCIGTSITHAELAQVNDDEHQQNWAYHLMCKEFFMKDSIDANGGHDCLFLGQYKRNRTMKYKDVDYPIITHHEGVRGISLSSYLNGGVAAFKSDTTGKFSINAWLSKYRTFDDSGNRLTLGDGTGTLITSSNINDIDVCAPTHVLIELGTNGGGTIEQYRELINIIKTEFPNMIIGITLSDAAGTFFPSLHPNCSEKMTIWNDTGSQGSRHNQQYDLVSMLQKEFANKQSEDNKIFFLPFYFVQPTAQSVAMRRVDLPDAGIQLTARNLYNDSYGWHASTHVNGIGHINWGYQLYSWLKYTIAKQL